MAAVAEPLLMTVEQYRRLPEQPGVIQESHLGQVVRLAPPKMGHTKLQHRLVELLKQRAGDAGAVAAEVPFRALPEYDLRGADVAFVSRERWDTTDDNDNLRGSPELVIEVLSPSNTKAEIREKAALYLATGAREFWVVDAKRKTVSVTVKGRGPVVYGMGERIPLGLFGGELAVTEVFGASA